MLKLCKPWRNITGLTTETEGMCISWNGYPNVTISTSGEPKHIGETLVFFNKKSCLQMHTNSFVRIWTNDLSILDNLAPRSGEWV
jgi:hypothetical protein